MSTEEKTAECCKSKHVFKHGGGSNAIYGLGVVGALFYFLQHSHNLGEVLLGIGKAFFWPALLMFRLLSYLKM